MAACIILGGAFGWALHSYSSRPETALTTAASQQQAPPSSAATKASMPGPGALAMKAVIPPNASPELKEFLENRATLANSMAQLRNQMSQTQAGGTSMQEAMQQFRQQNKALLDRQTQLAQQLAQQSAQQPMKEPPPLHLPPNASPQLQAFLTARDQVMRDQIAMMNQYRTADPATRQAAMQQWRQQNAAKLQQLQQLAQNLSQANSNKTTN